MKTIFDRWSLSLAALCLLLILKGAGIWSQIGFAFFLLVWIFNGKSDAKRF